VSEPEPSTEARRIAAEARDRVRFEEEALALADQIYRVARRLVGSREEAEDLVQETYARAFRSWRSYTPGTNLRAWLLRILTNLNLDRGRKLQRTPDLQPLGLSLLARMAQAERAVLAIAGHRALLEENTMLRRSIDVRNPYVDPIHVLQAELLRRVRAGDEAPETLDALLVTINGIAAGMRNTG